MQPALPGKLRPVDLDVVGGGDGTGKTLSWAATGAISTTARRR
jgi:hypothetical protein